MFYECFDVAAFHRISQQITQYRNISYQVTAYFVWFYAINIHLYHIALYCIFLLHGHCNFDIVCIVLKYIILY